METQPLLSARISAGFPGRTGILRDLQLDMRLGEVLGLVGQSGCGKSTLALAILRLLDLKGGKAEGTIFFRGHDLMGMKEKEMSSIRGREIALVLQSPIASLNPALRIGAQLEEAWKVHHPYSPRRKSDEVLVQALEDVSLSSPREILRLYPSQLSVGQAQRVLIGMAILHRPALLIADEATSALDIHTQSEILELFKSLNSRFGMGILYISHDILSVAAISHRVAVMDQGQIVECGETREIFRNPTHPTTRKMMAAMPAMWSAPEKAKVHAI